MAADALLIVWFTTAGLGLLAGLGGLLASRRRREFMLAAGAFFAVAGLLGLASIGIVFVGLSAWCFVLANRADTEATPRSAHRAG